MPSILSVDLGITNFDLVIEKNGAMQYIRHTNPHLPQPAALLQCLKENQLALADFDLLIATGSGQTLLPENLHGVPVIKVNEMDAIGLGGLTMTRLDEALVISAGSGTALIAANRQHRRHITGSAVGGGTLQGLGRLLLGTADALEIDAMAQQGDANQVDTMISEVMQGKVGSLPADANAVNFGKLAWLSEASVYHEDVAAGLVRLVAQVIAMVAVNAARAENLNNIVVIGHLMDLPSICASMRQAAGFYQRSIIIPQNPGFGTVTGARTAGLPADALPTT